MLRPWCGKACHRTFSWNWRLFFWHWTSFVIRIHRSIWAVATWDHLSNPKSWGECFLALGSTKRINNQDPIQRFFSSEVEQGETLHCFRRNFGLRFATVRSLSTSIPLQSPFQLLCVGTGQHLVQSICWKRQICCPSEVILSCWFAALVSGTNRFFLHHPVDPGKTTQITTQRITRVRITSVGYWGPNWNPTELITATSHLPCPSNDEQYCRGNDTKRIAHVYIKGFQIQLFQVAQNHPKVHLRD